MPNSFKFPRLAFVAALAALISVSSARADVRFHNTTDQSLKFQVSCNGAGHDTWTVGAHGTRSLYCMNTSDVMAVTIRTAENDGGEATVRTLALDGDDLDLGYDDDGDVSIVSRW